MWPFQPQSDSYAKRMLVMIQVSGTQLSAAAVPLGELNLNNLICVSGHLVNTLVRKLLFPDYSECCKRELLLQHMYLLL